VSALLLDDALLKCVVTEVVLFSIVAFKILTFHKVYSVATNLRCGSIFRESIIRNVLLHVYSEICLKIGQYLMKFRRTKQSVSVFGGVALQ